MGSMRWATAISRDTDLDEAVAGCAAELRRELGEGPVSLALIFVTPHHRERYREVPSLVLSHLGADALLGCSGGGVIGGGEEVEGAPAVTLTAARMRNVEVRGFRIGGPGALPDLDGPPDAWEELVGARAAEEPQFVLLADPFSSDPVTLLSGLDYAFPGAAKVGGLASGATSAGEGALFVGEDYYASGTAGLALTGDVAVDTVVAQGCKPVGGVMQITSCQDNVLQELDGRPAFKALEEVYAALDERDRKLAGSALFVGMLMDEFEEEPGPGDFLIRNLIGVDPQNGSLGVGERLQEGMRVQFHLRDAEASAEDLRAVLTGYERAMGPARASGEVSGALLFSCLGRGEGLYGEPGFDTGVLHERLGPVPVGGFFCNGEFGPVGGTSFLHGYTSSFGLFRPRGPREGRQ
ncbi:FIST signal transduction protein [Rubrobacter aplysinae]|uniref:FIST signal transduction protein n=1 Tax=Rubrobacter aplysinae TaxID=909625 RepID=UPI001F39FCF9|nr:FIST N-terminal domain-containing protein [Rubrobacter aplysinae]